MTRKELEMRKLVRESDVIDNTDGSELARAFNYLWGKYIEREPCDDAISRAEAIRIASGYCHPANIPKELEKLPSVLPEPKTEVLDKIRAEIERMDYLNIEDGYDKYVDRYDVLKIIDKYKSESEGEE